MSELKTNSSINLRQRSFDFSVYLIRFINEIPRGDCNRVISNQLLRSGTSVGANIIEAKVSSSRKDFINFYHIALKSAYETKYWLSLLSEVLNLRSPKIDHLIAEVDEICKMLSASILTLKNKK